MLGVGFPRLKPQSSHLHLPIYLPAPPLPSKYVPSGSVGAENERGKGASPSPPPHPRRDSGFYCGSRRWAATPRSLLRCSQSWLPPASGKLTLLRLAESTNVLRKTNFKNVENRWHIIRGMTWSPGPEVAACGKFGTIGKGEGSGAAGIPSERSRWEQRPVGHKFAWECFPFVNN